MRFWLRQSVTLLAIYAVALHVILLGFAPIGPAGANAADSFGVICHAVAPSEDGTSPAAPHLIPGSACDHCNLCSATTPPTAPQTAFDFAPVPAFAAPLWRTAHTVPRPGVTSDPKLARGPPRLS
jgi:hypothetical protein